MLCRLTAVESGGTQHGRGRRQCYRLTSGSLHQRALPLLPPETTDRGTRRNRSGVGKVPSTRLAHTFASNKGRGSFTPSPEGGAFWPGKVSRWPAVLAERATEQARPNERAPSVTPRRRASGITWSPS